MKYLVKDAIQGTLLRIEYTMDDAILEKDKWQAISSKHNAVIETVEEEEERTMKKYRFAVSNWKNPQWSGFWFYKEFRSAYEADQYAMRISFRKKNSMYLVSLRD